MHADTNLLVDCSRLIDADESFIADLEAVARGLRSSGALMQIEGMSDAVRRLALRTDLRYIAEIGPPRDVAAVPLLRFSRPPPEWLPRLGHLLTARDLRERGDADGPGVLVAPGGATIVATATADDDDEAVYPEFQFDAGGRLRTDVQAVVRRFLNAEVDPYVIAAWFQVPHGLLNDRSPAQWLEAHGVDEHLDRAVFRDVARLSR